MTPEELNLLDALQKNPNDQKAFAELVRTYQELLYWNIRRIVISHDDADDVLQNVFVKAWKGIGTFQRKSSLKTWLYKISTNEALTFLTQQKRRPAIPIGGLEYDLSDVIKAQDGYDGNKAAWKLQQAIQTLPEKQRQVFNMKYFDEITYEELSEILDTSVGALKASFHHAVKKIETYLKENSD